MDQNANNKPPSTKDRFKKKEDGDMQFKVIIVGDSGVGKSCLLTRYVKDVFVPQHKVTLVHQSFRSVILNQNDTALRQLQGQIANLGYCWPINLSINRQNILSQQFSSDASLQSSQVISYQSSKQSFENLGSWLKEARENAPQTAFYVLVGTHSDLYEDRQVEKRDIQLFKGQAEIVLSFQTSAKTNLNVNIAFEQIAAQCFDNYMKRRSTMRTLQATKGTPLQQPKDQKNENKEGCC